MKVSEQFSFINHRANLWRRKSRLTTHVPAVLVAGSAMSSYPRLRRRLRALRVSSANEARATREPPLYAHCSTQRTHGPFISVASIADLTARVETRIRGPKNFSSQQKKTYKKVSFTQRPKKTTTTANRKLLRASFALHIQRNIWRCDAIWKLVYRKF